MPSRDEYLRKIALHSVCADKKPQAVNDGKRQQPRKCYELQSGHHLMDMQSTAHPPVERLGTNVECQRQSRLATEMFMKYPFMLPPIHNSKQEMADVQVGKTTYRVQYRDPHEVIAELERIRFLKARMAEWKPDCGPNRLPYRQYRGGSKINFTQNEWGPRQVAVQKLADEAAYRLVKEPKFYPWTTEYRANIESMAKFIIKEDIFRKEKVTVKRAHTLPM